jgi:hypothetical protein
VIALTHRLEPVPPRLGVYLLSITTGQRRTFLLDRVSIAALVYEDVVDVVTRGGVRVTRG